MSLPTPFLGDPLPIRASAEMLDRLATRRSSPAQALNLPGPSPDQVEVLLTLAARTPDHGKLAPWRFVLIDSAAKPALLARLAAIAEKTSDPDSSRAKLTKLAAAPLTVLIVSRVQTDSKIPTWEQELSAGAVCMSMLMAAAAMGFGANWITDWYAYEPAALDVLGLRDGERVAGFIHVGTPSEPPLERVRPDLGDLVRTWTEA